MIPKEVFLLEVDLQKNKLFNHSIESFKTAKSISDLVGNTPLLRLRGPSEQTKCEILGR